MYCKCTLYAGENKAILMLHVLCDVTYNFQQNLNYWRYLHQLFPGLFETFGSMSEISFLVLACHNC